MEDSTRGGTAMKKRTNKEIEETGGSIVDCFAYVVVDVTLWYVPTPLFCSGSGRRTIPNAKSL